MEIIISGTNCPGRVIEDLNPEKIAELTMNLGNLWPIFKAASPGQARLWD